MSSESSKIDHPAYYGGDTEYEVIKVLEAWDLELAKGFCWGNLIKYTARAGQKDSELADRQKAEWYANRLAKITEKLEAQEPELGIVRKPPSLIHIPPPADLVIRIDWDECGWEIRPRNAHFAPGTVNGGEYAVEHNHPLTEGCYPVCPGWSWKRD